jgi:ribulose-5-phosphate 4-epimerase/fuculose-1-phosphate aldolase
VLSCVKRYANLYGAPIMTSLATLRRHLAASLRLAAQMGFNEGICNHFSVVVPGRSERYLINPYGIHWLEMEPEDLLMIDGSGTILEGHGEVEATARNIHVAGHRANPRHQAIFHVHMPYATALTMIEGGRLEMAHQTAARFHGRMAHQAFGGVALDPAQGEAIARAQKDNPEADIIFLDHHGVTVGAPSCAIALDDLYYLERACKQQVLAMSTGRPLVLISPAMVEQTAAEWRQVLTHQAEKHFEALLRMNGL